MDIAQVKFVGDFYVSTQFSVFRFRVKNLEDTPQVMKMAYKGNPPKKVPVCGTLRPRCYWAITAIGIVPYRMENQQKEVADFTGTLLPVEKLPRSRCGQRSRPIMGLFLKQEDAEGCVEYCARQQRLLDGFEDGQFDTSTSHVLRKIGLSHPLITVSTTDKGHTKFGLPQRLLCHILLPID